MFDRSVFFQMLCHLSEHDGSSRVSREPVLEERNGIRHAATQATLPRCLRPQLTAGEPFLQLRPYAALLVGDQVDVAGLALAAVNAADLVLSENAICSNV